MHTYIYVHALTRSQTSGFFSLPFVLPSHMYKLRVNRSSLGIEICVSLYIHTYIHTYIYIYKLPSHMYKLRVNRCSLGIEICVSLLCVYIYIYIHTHTHTHTYIYVWLCIYTIQLGTRSVVLLGSKNILVSWV
jgi:hypothetical protein